MFYLLFRQYVVTVAVEFQFKKHQFSIIHSRTSS